jgi:hypothetical protein
MEPTVVRPFARQELDWLTATLQQSCLKPQRKALQSRSPVSRAVTKFAFVSSSCILQIPFIFVPAQNRASFKP